MKVITPNLDQAITRTSIQLQQQVEIVNTDDFQDRQGYGSEQPIPIEAPIIPSSAPMSHVMPPSSAPMSHVIPPSAPMSHVIPPSSAPMNHVMPQRETMIDDVPTRQSTRGEESPNLERMNQSGWDSSQDEANHTPTTPNHVHKFSYLHPTPGGVPYLTQQYSPKKHKTSVGSNGGSSTSLSSTNEPTQTILENTYGTGATSAHKSTTLLPSHQGYPPPSLTNSSTASSDNEEESEFTKALKKGKEKLVNSPATRKRSSTMPSNARRGIQHSHLATNSPVNSSKNAESTAPALREPLAAAIMRKIDSIRIDSSDQYKSSDEEDSFSKTPPTKLKSYIQPVKKEKAVPPAPKPKPQMQRAITVDPSLLLDDNRQSGTITNNNTDRLVQKEQEQNSDEESTGPVNWKSVLRPVKRTESGRASPSPSDNRNNTSQIQSPRRGSLKKPIEQVVNDLTQFGIDTGDYLPPPLPVNAYRLSVEFHDIPPPEDFLSLAGAETRETNTDHIIGPPSLNRIDDYPSPPPPPPPNSSPPREPLDHSQLIGVRFPPLSKRAATLPASTNEDKVPCPIPSPMHPSSFDADMESEPILPPQEFTHRSEDQGFEIPTPPGFEISTPLPEEIVVGKKSDLDQAIRELQLLSEDLTIAPAKTSKGTPSAHSGQQLDSSPKQQQQQPSTLPSSSTVYEPPMTVDNNAVFIPPPTRSRSSTSSSNVSSLTR